ncbi:unnamed protein product [Withania somnifera]
MGFGSSLLKGIHFGERGKSRRTKVVESNITTTTYVYRDELDKKKKPKIKKQVKFDLEPKYISQEEEIISSEEEEKNTIADQKEKSRVQESVNYASYDGVIKVKIMMKKEDAARLLLKCRDGRALEFMDVAQQLVQVPSSSVTVLSS